MGVLDGLPGNDQGGLLGGLPSWWQYQTPEVDLPAGSPVPFSGGSAGWSTGALAPTPLPQSMASAPPLPSPQTIAAAPQAGSRLRPTTAAGPTVPIQPTVAPSGDLAPPQAAAQAPLSGFFNRLADGLQSVAHGGSLAGAIRGQYDDSASKQAQVQNVTAKALLARGIDPQAVNAAVQPGNGELLRSLIAQAYGPQPVQSLGNGYIYKPNTGKVERAFRPDDEIPAGFRKTAAGLEPIPGGPADPAYLRARTNPITNPVTNKPSTSKLSPGQTITHHGATITRVR